ncbi:MAG: GatB/YqeY domain-containing protein [Nitrospirae bacterium]|nr:GatB/YqeY domain-containing protein [Nitrospirota bacterium]
MSVSERLSEDLKKAMKSGDKEALSVVRMVKASVKNKEIDKGAALSDDEISGVILTLVRQGKDSLEQFSKAGRQDLVLKEERELKVLQSYLPPQMPEEELTGIIKDAIAEVGSNSQKDMGRIMKVVLSKAKGRVDGKIVSEMVKKELV